MTGVGSQIRFMHQTCFRYPKCVAGHAQLFACLSRNQVRQAVHRADKAFSEPTRNAAKKQQSNPVKLV